MEREPVSSEALRSVGYQDGTLEIEFVTGSIYQYFDVPERVYEELRMAESKGAFFQTHIRAQFRYARV
jgi:hypothetical protein